jgi:hypothetical protein
MHKGVCVGGPMAGLTITTQSEDGFVAVDAAGFAAWLYYVDCADGHYQLDTRPDPSSLDDDGTRALDRDRALTAATDKGLDVIALPGEDDTEAPAEAPAIDETEDDAEEGEH